MGQAELDLEEELNSVLADLWFVRALEQRTELEAAGSLVLVRAQEQIDERSWHARDDALREAQKKWGAFTRDPGVLARLQAIELDQGLPSATARPGRRL